MQFFDLEPSHSATVHDISFDYYGSIKVWDLVEEEEENYAEGQNGDGKLKSKWLCSEIAKPHSGSIWRLSWAHPEFGQIFASCSEDKSVIIWEEQEVLSSEVSENRIGRWLKKTQLFDSKKSVNDVKFAPRQLGLKLATASADGMVRIYEANDLFSSNYWPIQDSFMVTEDLSTSSATSTVDQQQQQQQHQQVEHGLTCLAWSDCPFELPRLVVGGYSTVASIWIYEGGKWKQEMELAGQQQPIHDLAWAPTMGRSYHLIACASRECCFHIHTLGRKQNSEGDTQTGLVLLGSVRIPSPSEVWRVGWNSTGTVLATSGEDGTLSLWRRNFSEEWVNVQNLPLVGTSKSVYTSESH